MSKQFDNHQLDDIYRQQQPRLHAYIRQQIANEDDAQDILQDVI